MRVVESDLSEEGLDDFVVPAHLIVVEDELGTRSYASAETEVRETVINSYAGLASKVERDRLLAACRAMSDAELLDSFKDCVLPLAFSQEDRVALTFYFKSRKNAPYWGPGGHGNNHANIPERDQPAAGPTRRGRKTLTDQERRQRRNEASARSRAKRLQKEQE